MIFLVSIADIRAWITFNAVLLWITTELLSPYLGKVNIVVDKRKLRAVTNLSLVLFALAFAVSLYTEIVLSS